MVFGGSTKDCQKLLHSFEMNLNLKGKEYDEMEVDNATFQTVREHVASLNQQNTDLIFLKSLIESPVMDLVSVQDKFEEKLADLNPLGTGNDLLANDICQQIDRISHRPEASELLGILKSRNFKDLLQAHDSIAEQYYLKKGSEEDSSEEKKKPKKGTDKSNMSLDSMDSSVPIRLISLRKSPTQPLGITVEVEAETGNLVVARVISGGMIDRLGLLKVGDVILEVNDVRVPSPEKLQTEVAKARGDGLQLKVASSLLDKPTIAGRQVQDDESDSPTPTNSPIPNTKELQYRNRTKIKKAVKFAVHKVDGQTVLCFMRAQFTYDPKLDTLSPCKELSLSFKTGDILQIVDQSDPNWWQAKKVGENIVGLIPSRELEERRAAFVRPEADLVHSIGICGTRIARKKRKCVYTAKQNSEFDRAELILYEEVTRMPPFRRKTLVIVGSSINARRTLKNRLINSDPNRFGTVLPMTTRPPREGEEQMNTYLFVSREKFDEGIRHNKFLEFGEKDGNLYGTSVDSLREVIRQGKMCIMDCNPTVLKILHNSPEFMPYVVFLQAPGAGDVQQQDAFERQHGYSSRTLSFERASSIRHSSRRARTLESIASLYEEDDIRHSLEESHRLRQLYSPYFDSIVVNEDFDSTFRKVAQALDNLSTDHQWVPVTWVYQ